jgi:energy-coupling factor transport system substrate-specific component
MNEESKLEKLKGTDFITIGIFGLLYTIAVLAPAFITGLVQYLFTYTFAISAFPCGIVFMYILAKVPKRWGIASAVIISCLIFFLLVTLGVWTPLIGAAGALLADVIAGTGKYKKFGRNAAAFVVCITIQWLGFMQPIMLTTSQYIESAVESGLPADQIQPFVEFVKGPGFVTGLIATVICGFLGALLGKRVLRKHFKKAGIV